MNGRPAHAPGKTITAIHGVRGASKPQLESGFSGLKGNRLQLTGMNQDPYKVYRTIARVGSVLLLLLGAMALFGGLWDVGAFTTALPGSIAMKPSLAIGCLFLGLALSLWALAFVLNRTEK